MMGLRSTPYWHTRLFCKCGYSITPAHNDVFFLDDKCCPICGVDSPSNNVFSENYIYSDNCPWKFKKVKWVDTSKWWNPYTWEKGYYEEYMESESDRGTDS